VQRGVDTVDEVSMRLRDPATIGVPEVQGGATGHDRNPERIEQGWKQMR
jgi:hypothetical protein